VPGDMDGLGNGQGQAQSADDRIPF
jgi:hypothetical protein